MATQTPIVGWTEKRKQRGWMFWSLLAASAAAVLWAMVLPWAGTTVGASEPTCELNAADAPVQVRNVYGQVVTISGTGCVSALQSLKKPDVDAAAGTSVPGSLSRNAEPTGSLTGMRGSQFGLTTNSAPKPELTYGVPPMTFWALVAAVMAMLCAIVRNGFFLLPALVSLNLSHKAFVEFRTYLMGGLDGLGAEMIGVAVHQYVFAFVAVLVIATGWFVLKVNAEQRKLDGRPHPVVAGISMVASTLLRVNEDRLATMSAALRGDKQAVKAS